MTGAELPLARKNELSHRGQAMRALLARLDGERASLAASDSIAAPSRDRPRHA